MAKTARSLVDVVLGEAVAGTRAQRYEDMKAVASAVVNRANALGVSVKDVLGAKGQFDAYGKSLPPGVEAFRSLAEKAIAEVEKYGPTHPGMFYATPKAVDNLPSGLQPVAKTTGHVYFDDPQNRAIATAQGFVTPSVGVDQAAYAPATKTAVQSPFDALFSGVETSPANDLGSSPTSSSMQFSNPLGAFTDRVTSGFGPRSSPMGIGSTNHLGVDMSAAPGQAGYPAEAAAPGVVSFAGPAGGYGSLVEVTHEDGSKTRYGHLAGINVAVGDRIARGTPIGTVGSKGASTGAHLHFEAIDPLGNRIDPRSVTDFTNRSLSVTPSPRPSQDAASGFSSMAAAGPLGFAAATRPSQDIASGFASMAAAGPMGLTAATPDAARFGSPVGAVAGPVSPAGGYAAASAPAKSGGLGGLGGIAPPDPDRYGPAPMSFTPTTVSLSSTANAANMTPMAASLSPVGLAAQSLSSPIQRAAEDAGYLTTHVNTTSVAPTAMGLLPSTAQAPVGSFSTFNPVPTDMNVLNKALNKLPTNPPLSLPNMPAIPSLKPPAVTPMVTPTVARQPVSPQTTASVRSAPPAFSAADVYSGKAPVGYQAPATGGNRVSRDQFGNTSVTNSYGVTTVTDPSGRQMGNLGGLGKGIGGLFDKVPAGMVGSVIGGAIAGMPGAVIGGVIGNKMGGQSNQKSGGLGGLGGFLSGLFGGGNSGNGGGGSSGSRGGGSSGSRGGPAGADRDHAGNN